MRYLSRDLKPMPLSEWQKRIRDPACTAVICQSVGPHFFTASWDGVFVDEMEAEPRPFIVEHYEWVKDRRTGITERIDRHKDRRWLKSETDAMAYLFILVAIATEKG